MKANRKSQKLSLFKKMTENLPALTIIVSLQDEKHKSRYHIIGKDVCMGDHKVNY